MGLLPTDCLGFPDSGGAGRERICADAGGGRPDASRDLVCVLAVAPRETESSRQLPMCLPSPREFARRITAVTRSLMRRLEQAGQDDVAQCAGAPGEACAGLRQ